MQPNVNGATLLRPNQKADLQEEEQRLEKAINDPRARLDDRPSAVRRLKQVKQQLAIFTPKPYSDEEIDTAVRRERELREEITSGMPTQEEMRRAPPGAVGRHRSWEKKFEKKIDEWKEIRLRIHHDSDDPDIANLEQFRPSSGGQLNMDNARIPQKTAFFFPDTISVKNLMDPEARAKLKAETERVMKLIEEAEGPSVSEKPKKDRKKAEPKE